MSEENESPFDDSFKNELKVIADSFPLPTSVLELYLDGRLSEEGRKATEGYLAISERGRKDLELLKQLRTDEAEVSRGPKEGPSRSEELPPALAKRIRLANQADEHSKSLSPAGDLRIYHEGDALPKERLKTILPGHRYRVQPIEAGTYLIQWESSAVTFTCEPDELYSQQEYLEIRQAAQSQTGEGDSLAWTERSEDERFTVKIYEGFRRRDGSVVHPHMEISISA